MTMEYPPFEDVFPIENGDVPASHVSFQGSIPDKKTKPGLPCIVGRRKSKPCGFSGEQKNPALLSMKYWLVKNGILLTQMLHV